MGIFLYWQWLQHQSLQVSLYMSSGISGAVFGIATGAATRAASRTMQCSGCITTEVATISTAMSAWSGMSPGSRVAVLAILAAFLLVMGIGALTRIGAHFWLSVLVLGLVAVALAAIASLAFRART
jgi:hypothetical protein